MISQFSARERDTALGIKDGARIQKWEATTHISVTPCLRHRFAGVLPDGENEQPPRGHP